jgi:hypothetical protein
MARSDRLILRGVQGRVRHNHNFAPIHQDSAVIITACEFRFAGGVFGAAGRPFLGTQQMSSSPISVPITPRAETAAWNFISTLNRPLPLTLW